MSMNFQRCIEIGTPPLALVAGFLSIYALNMIGSPMKTAMLIAGMGCVLLSAASATAGLSILLTLVVVYSHAELWNMAIPLGGGGLKVTDILVAAILAGWIARASLRLTDLSRLRLTIVPVIVALLLWAVFGAVKGIWSGIPYKDSLVELRPLLAYLLVLPVLSELTPQRVRRVLWVVILASLAAAGRAIYYYSVGIGEVLDTGMRVRPIGFSYILAGVLIVLALYGSRRLSLGWASGLLGIAMIGLAITLFRSAALGLAAGTAFLVVFMGMGERVRLAQVFGLFAAMAVLLAITAERRNAAQLQAVAERMLSVGSYQSDRSSVHRLREWQAVVESVKERPLMGGGLGSRVFFYSPEYSMQHRRYGFWSWDFYVHNSYLWAAAKMGLVGLGLLLAAITVPLATGIRRLARREIDPEVRPLMLAVCAALIGMAVISFFGPMLTSLNEAPFIAFLLGAVHVCTTRSERMSPAYLN